MTNNPDLIDLAMQLPQQDEAQDPETAPPLLIQEPAIEDRATDLVVSSPPEQMAVVPDLQNRAITKEFRTADELAAMILSDMKQVPGCPVKGVSITVYGLSPWNSWLHFGAAAGPVRNKAELQEFCSILTKRLRVRYDVQP